MERGPPVASKDIFQEEITRLVEKTGWSREEAIENFLRAKQSMDVEEAPAAEGEPSLRSGYQAAVQPITAAGGEAIGRLFQTMAPGSTKKFNQPAEGSSAGAGNMIAKGVVPQTPEQAVLALIAPHIARMGPSGGNLLQSLVTNPARRVGTATAVGAGVAGGTGGSPLEGALTGAVSQVPAELMRGVGHLATRGTQQGLMDATRVGNTLRGISPDFEGISTPGDFLRVVTLGQEATTQASHKLNAGLKLLEVGMSKEFTRRIPPLRSHPAERAAAMPGHPYSPHMPEAQMSPVSQPKANATNVPSLAKMFPESFGRTDTGITVQEVDKLFRHLGEQAFEDGALRAGVKALDIAHARSNAAKEIASWIQGYSPKLAKFWEGLNTDYARTQAVVRVLRQPDIIDGATGRLNMRQLQETLKIPDTSKDLQQKLSTGEVTRFYNAAFRRPRGGGLEEAGATELPVKSPQSISDTGRTAGVLRALTQIRPARYVGENAPQPSSLQSLSTWAQRGGLAVKGMMAPGYVGLVDE